VNLGWKLAQVVHGVSPESLLDTYQAERHPVGARVLKTTLAQTAITRGDDRTTELREVLSELFKMEEPRKRYAARMSGLDIAYDLGAERGSREDAGAAAPPGAGAGAATGAGAGAATGAGDGVASAVGAGASAATDARAGAAIGAGAGAGVATDAGAGAGSAAGADAGAAADARAGVATNARAGAAADARAGAATDARAGAGACAEAPANHPLLGRRMPDLDLDTREGPRRVFSLLREARPVLVNLGEPGALDISPWASRVQRLDASYAGAWELPVLGAVAAPAAVLIRPDGHVAWVGDGTDRGLRDALTRWFGA
jgi:FAD binding domain